MSPWLPSLLIGFLALAGRSVSAQGQTAAPSVEQGLALLRNHREQAALVALTRVVRRQPTNPFAHLALGLAALSSGDTATAETEYETALGLRTGCAVGHNALGLLCLQTGRPQRAYTHFQNALRFDPSYAEARANLAYTLCLQGIAGQAVNECRRMLKEAVDDPFVLEVAATANILQGDLGTAAEQIRRLKRLVVSRPGAFWSLEGAERNPAASPSRNGETGGQGLLSHELSFTLSRGRLLIERPLPAPVTVARHTVVLASVTVGNCRYVAFLVDGAMRAVTNKPPYRWEWDTTRVTNGVHVVAAQAYGPGGMMLSQAFRHVVVKNRGRPPTSLPVAPGGVAWTPGSRSVDRELRDLLRVRADPARVEQLLAEGYEQHGEPDNALTAYTDVFLADPNRQGVHAAVLRLRRQLGWVPLTARVEVWRVLGTGHKLALTFDDGPRPFYTDRILKILRDHDVKATFFMVGEMAAAYPDLVRAIVADGHEIGNHSYSHPNLAKLSETEVEQELLRAEQVIRQTCRRRTRLFRPPGGNYGPAVRTAARNLGYTGIFWGPNITTWKNRAPHEIALALAHQVQDGCFVLLHNGKDKTLAVLPFLLRLLNQRRYRFVTVSELLRAGRPVSTGGARTTNEY